jgi:Ca-activated chloride channel family protein
MIVLGDGQSMAGAFIELAGTMAETGMTVTTVALGDGADQQLMQEIARVGRGRYYATMDPATVPRIFTKETVEASRSAIREEPVLPVRVGQADLLGGIDFDAIPLLLGYVMTRAKPTAQVQLVTEAGDPLLALGRYGLGRSVAFTSDAADRWASQWVQWDGFGQFWAQVLRSCLRKSDSTGVEVNRTTTPERVRFVLSSKGPDGEPADEENWQALLVDDSGVRSTPDVTQVGLGLYQIDVPRARRGRFTLRLAEPTSDKIKVLHHDEDYPAEYRLAGSMDPALAELPRLPGADAAADLPVMTTRRPVRNHLLLAAMACLIAGIALRRL